MSAASSYAPVLERYPSLLAVRTSSPERPTSFAAIYDEYAKFVWRALVRLGVASRDVEDVVQEVFLVVHRRLAEFRHESTMRTWVYGIAVHVARNYRRTGARRQHGTDVDPNEKAEAVPEPAEHAPDVLLAKAQAAELLIRVLQELDQDSREVFVLAELEEMTAVEIGEILSLSPNTVSSRLRAARRAFDASVRRNMARDQWRIR